MRIMRIFVHPVTLVLGMLLSIVLWMPFGMGYYGWPWGGFGWRIVLYTFVFIFPLLALGGCIGAISGKFFLFRFLVSISALLIGLVGMCAMLNWMARYVEPMLR